jgi:hypothetical protein
VKTARSHRLLQLRPPPCPAAMGGTVPARSLRRPQWRVTAAPVLLFCPQPPRPCPCGQVAGCLPLLRFSIKLIVSLARWERNLDGGGSSVPGLSRPLMAASPAVSSQLLSTERLNQLFAESARLHVRASAPSCRRR